MAAGRATQLLRELMDRDIIISDVTKVVRVVVTGLANMTDDTGRARGDGRRLAGQPMDAGGSGAR